MRKNRFSLLDRKSIISFSSLFSFFFPYSILNVSGSILRVIK